MATNFIKLFSCVAMVLCMVHQSEAKPSGGTMRYLKLKCDYQCMTDFDMCSSLCENMEMYIMCFRAQGSCRKHCKSKYGVERKPRSLYPTATLVPDKIRIFRARLDAALKKKKEQWKSG